VTKQVEVLVVGGSLVGLTTSLFLAQQGVDVLTVEKHLGTAVLPRAAYLQLRTMELLRVAGIEDKVRAASLANYAPNGGIGAVETLAGSAITNFIPSINYGIEDVSPARRLFLSQHILEPILLQKARNFGADIQFSTEMISYDQDSTGVTATLYNRLDKSSRTVRAKYMVACDGNRSPIRSSLGIHTTGHGLLSRCVTIYFRADCSKALRNRNINVIYVNNDKLRGFFRLDTGGLGGSLAVFTAGDVKSPDARFVADTVTDASAAQMIRDAVGDPHLRIDSLSVDKWKVFSDVATTFQSGRILLAGDAAHTVPPTGGFGGNVGIHDAHNLAWKLAAVLQGQAGPDLINTYNQERQPAGALVVEQAYTRYVTRSDPELGTVGMQVAVPDMHVEFNRYRSGAVLPDVGYIDDGAIDIDPRLSRGLPGTRAPHVELTRDGEVISTLDLYTGEFILVAGPDGPGWANAVMGARAALGVDLLQCRIDRGDTQAWRDSKDGRHTGDLLDTHGAYSTPFWTKYGIGPSGATLVRPDGYVAWRAIDYTPDAAERLIAALRSVLAVGASK